MKQTAATMGMQATVMIAEAASQKDIAAVFAYFQHIDETFSTYKPTSEISRINSNLLALERASEEVRQVLTLCEKAARETNGYFSMKNGKRIDPSGLVKGYAIHQAAKMLEGKGYKNFFVEIAGDIEIAGKNEEHESWRVGIENPFNRKELIKVVGLSDCGIATSGTYLQGTHIYDPIGKKPADEIVSVSVIAETVEKADVLATAAFAMGEKGIAFLERLSGVEGYMVTKEKKAIMTSGFDKYVMRGENEKE